MFTPTPSILVVLTFFFGLIGAQTKLYPIAGLNTTWIVASSANNVWFPADDAGLIPTLLRSHNDLAFTCGFYSQGSQRSFYFVVSIVKTNPHSVIIDSVGPAVVWSANRDHPVGKGATVELTAGGDLVLNDAHGYHVWSTKTYGKSVAGINLTDTGNLVLFDKNKNAVWQSFDHPTDTLLPGQKLRVGQRLTPSVSTTNMSEYGLLSVSLTADGFFAQMETDPPQVYYHWPINFPNTSNDSNYVEFTQGHFALFVNFVRNGSLFSDFNSSVALQYLKLESDGHLKVYRRHRTEWDVAHDVLKHIIGDCGFPTVCGNYGICTGHGKCRCPDTYFQPRVDTIPGAGCSETVPLSCEASQSQTFLEFGGITGFTHDAPVLRNTDQDSCRKACANNCSCRAALYPGLLEGYEDSGACYLVSQVFSITDWEYPQLIIAIKVQNHSREIQISPIPSEPPVSPNGKRANAVPIVIITYSLGLLLVFFFLVVVIKNASRNKGVDEVEEEYLDQIPGAPKRFTYNDLKAITENFDNRLGEGGFGAVYQGTLADGTKVAVKHLNGLCQSKKSFLAEVESIGNIHHVNLVQLVGFCAEGSRRLLVYEYMSKGSLDKWIFHKLDESFVLNWQQRRKIICDMAKGLSYLHEECRWKIVHMDIKPQNILLDENFNAKVADFGLSKLVHRDQSQIVTTMRGTPGYLAPEWLHAAITEKVDVYSFGVVILQIVCGRKVFNESQNQEDMYLLGVFKRKREEGRLLEMIDKNSEDMQLNGPHVVNMMRLAAWCLQVDFKRRPSMSTVIKVLEGVIEVPDDLDYDFSYPTFTNGSARTGQEGVEFGYIVSVVPSVLSGPR